MIQYSCLEHLTYILDQLKVVMFILQMKLSRVTLKYLAFQQENLH